MPSPFPGVDPFIEASGRWLGFHHILIVRCSEQLNEKLPEQFAAFVDERPEESESYIDVVAFPSHEVVTRIEILTESQKSGEGFDRYLAERRALAGRGIHLVEIDLLLGGERLPIRTSLPHHDFYAVLSHGDLRGKLEFYPWSIRAELPTVPVQLTNSESLLGGYMSSKTQALLDLSTAFRTTYDRGRYDRSLRYDLPVPECLAEDDRMWVIERLRASGKYR